MEIPKLKTPIYLDHAATTPMDPRVAEAMLPYYSAVFGNPSAIYELGRDAREAREAARALVARLLGAKSPEEIIFTGSGTESINLAIQGVIHQQKSAHKGATAHVITQATEHHAVLHTLKYLSRNEGVEVTILPVDGFGRVSPEQVVAAIKPETVLISLMMANNEIGTIQPIADIAKAVKAQHPGVLVHTDACQAAGALPINVQMLGVDLLTINGSKIYGPKGIGALWVRTGVQVHPIIHGGGQERGKRSGTENMAAIAGFAKALEIAEAERERESARLTMLRNKLIAGILAAIPKTRLNGHSSERLPNNVNVTVLDIEGEALLLYLDEIGISASTGSACDSATLDPSHVILALGLPYEYAHGSLRLTLGRSTTNADIDEALRVLPPIVALLRGISPVNLELKPEHATPFAHS